jgi:1,4-alpha-glucan branching enzyme
MADELTLGKAIDQLIHGESCDPFAVLGPHAAEVDGVRGVVIRALQPNTAGMAIEPAGAPPVAMTRRHARGVFEGFVPSDADPALFDYRLRIDEADGRTRLMDDPYRYGRVLGEVDLYLFAEGTQHRAHEKLGAHPMTIGSTGGVDFAVWAPSAARVSVVGDFNRWDGRVNPMRLLLPSGVWEIFIPDLQPGERYKFEIRSAAGEVFQKADPYGTWFETPPLSASIIRSASAYKWQDGAWMSARPRENCWLDRPMSIYEVHLASWARVPGQDGRFLTYQEMAERLVPYVKDMGYTHVELLPVMEHPFLGSWGYQVIGFFAPSSRFGTPEDFKALVDAFHREGIGVILDWVPGHFPKDAHGLARFDGTALYEHADPRQGEHADWGTLVFNYGRNEVRSFLLSNALFWLDEFHADGLRVDAVASMLYLDYSRKAGEWIPNKYGGRENLDAIEFLRQMNVLVHRVPGAIAAAEESTAWPAVSRPAHLGGLGFTYKWNMGWMHDILKYASLDPVYRRWNHNDVTFSMLYAFTENFILPFSHDEVVHGKGSMVGKMAGDDWQKFAMLRALYAFLMTHPGKKLMFMGDEIGQWHEWNHDRGLDWDVTKYPPHAGVQRLLRDLHVVYRREPALHQVDFEPAGFQWIDANDNENSVFSFIRRARNPRDFTMTVLNFTPVVRRGYRVGLPEPGFYRELVNTDSEAYWGSNVGNVGGVASEEVPAHGQPHSLNLVLPPLSGLILKKVED